MVANLTVIYMHIKTLTDLLQNMIMVAASSLYVFLGIHTIAFQYVN